MQSPSGIVKIYIRCVANTLQNFCTKSMHTMHEVIQKLRLSKTEGYPKPKVLEGRKHRKDPFKR
ncbi:hypothetical protein EON70_00955 [bacterium]|nr:MAG: hypothetical protein EON70_00955 [bacterium]